MTSEQLKPAQMDAMQALFDFSKAMESGLSIDDLASIMRLAIEDGHDKLAVGLHMALAALQSVKPTIPMSLQPQHGTR